MCWQTIKFQRSVFCYYFSIKNNKTLKALQLGLYESIQLLVRVSWQIHSTLLHLMLYLPLDSHRELYSYFIQIGSSALSNTYIHAYIYTHIHTYIYTHIHIYVYIYIHIYTHTYIYTYIYIHSFVNNESNGHKTENK